MSLESYLILVCLAGNPQGCSKSAEAYYIYSGLNNRIEDYVKRIEKEDEQTLFFVTLSASAVNKQFAVPISRNKTVKMYHNNSLCTDNIEFVWNF